VGHASRSSSLLGVEASLARVSQSGLKTAEARLRVVHVTPSRRLRQRQAEAGRVDTIGCVGRCYPCFAVFLLLGLRGVVVILAFCLSLYIGSYRVGALCHLPISFLRFLS
jgi:hypothetical protein